MEIEDFKGDEANIGEVEDESVVVNDEEMDVKEDEEEG